MSSGDIEAGNAVVKIVSDDEGFRAGLKNSITQLRAFADDMRMARSVAESGQGTYANLWESMQGDDQGESAMAKAAAVLDAGISVGLANVRRQFEAMAPLIKAFAEGLVAPVTKFFDAIKSVSDLIRVLIVEGDKVDAFISRLATGAAKLAEWIPGLGLVRQAFESTAGGVSTLYRAVTGLLALPGKVVSAFTAIPRAIGSAMTSTAAATISAFRAMTTAAVDASRKALAAISSAVVTSARYVASAIATTLAAAGRATLNPGRYIIQPMTNAAASVANSFSSAFASIGEKFQALAGRVAMVGGVISGAAASIIVPLTAAAKKFSDAGVDADRLADRLGMSVEAAQELAFAAKQVDVSPDALQGAVTQSTKVVKTSFDTGDPGVLKELGLDAVSLQAMDAERRFVALGTAVAGITDPIRQAVVAQQIFGDVGQNLLPLFENNGRSLAEWREEANRLGIVMSGPAAASAVAMARAYQGLQDAIAGLWRNVGEAVAPAITTMTNELALAIKQVTKWVNEHKPLIATIFDIASTVATIGSVVLGVAGALGGIGTVFSVMAGAAASVGTAITVIGGALAAILTPLGVVLAAVAGVAVVIGRAAVVSGVFSAAVSTGSRALGTFSASATAAIGPVIDALQRMYQFGLTVFQGIKDAFLSGELELAVNIAWLGAQTAWTAGLTTIANLTSGSMGAILNSLAAGEFATAFDIAWLGIKESFTRGIAYIEGLWPTLQGTFDGVAVYLQKTWNVVLQTLAKQTLQLIREFQKLLAPLSSYDPTGMLDKLNASINKSIGGSALQNIARQDVSDVNAKLDNDLAGRTVSREIEAERKRADREKQIAGLAGQRQAIEADMAEKAARRRQELDKRLADNLAIANKLREKVKEPQPPKKPNRVVVPDDEQGGGGGGAGVKPGGAAAESERTFVTFSAAGLIAGARAGGGGQASAQQGPAAIGQAVGQAVANANQNTQQQTLELLGGILTKATELALLTERQIEAIRAGGAFV